MSQQVCRVRFKHEGWKPRACVFTYRSRTKVDGVWVDQPVRCTNCGRVQP